MYLNFYRYIYINNGMISCDLASDLKSHEQMVVRRKIKRLE